MRQLLESCLASETTTKPSGRGSDAPTNRQAQRWSRNKRHTPGAAHKGQAGKGGKQNQGKGDQQRTRTTAGKGNRWAGRAQRNAPHSEPPPHSPRAATMRKRAEEGEQGEASTSLNGAERTIQGKDGEKEKAPIVAVPKRPQRRSRIQPGRMSTGNPANRTLQTAL